MSIKSLAHVCISSTNLDATADFYCGALGMKRIFNFVWKEKIIGFYMKASNETFIEVFHADEIKKIDRQPLGHFCLQTDSIETLRKTLVERGYSVRELIMGGDKSLQFWVTAPDGMDIEFQQYTEQSSQMTGQDVTFE